MDKINSLVVTFNGAIKYTPMLKDNPDWSEQDCLDFAKKWHSTAIAQLKNAFNRDRKGEGNWHNQTPCWNDRIPYCRNLPTLSMIEEALI